MGKKKENISEVIGDKLETAILFVNNVVKSSDYMSKAYKVFVKETEVSIGYTNRDFLRNNQSLRAVIRTRGQVKKIVLSIQFDNEFDGAVSFGFSKHKNGVSKNDSLVLTFEALKDSDNLINVVEESVKKIINSKF